MDCYRELHPDEPGYTFPASGPAIRFDYIFAPPVMRPRLLTCDVVDVPAAFEASDHRPLLARFALDASWKRGTPFNLSLWRFSGVSKRQRPSTQEKRRVVVVYWIVVGIIVRLLANQQRAAGHYDCADQSHHGAVEGSFVITRPVAASFGHHEDDGADDQGRRPNLLPSS